MQSDTRKLLITGAIILLAGVLAIVLIFTVFGGISREGPHNDGGWISLVVTMGCVPTAFFTLLLGLAKLIKDVRRS